MTMGGNSISSGGVQFGSSEADRRTLYAPLYAAVLNLLGVTGTITPLGDTQDEPSTPTTVTTRGEEKVVFTYSKDRSTFDVGLAFEGPSRIPVLKLDGIDEEADTPDSAYFSRVGLAFSLGIWINMVDATNSVLFAKYDATTGTLVREYRLYLDASDRPQFEIWDESADARQGRRDATALSENAWHHVGGTYNGDSGTNAGAGLKVYLDGVAVDDTDDDTGTFTDMENLGVKPTLGFNIGATANELFFDGKMAGGPLGPFFTQTTLSADAMLRLYQLGRAALGV